MYNYLQKQVNSSPRKKNNSLDYFYWKYIYGDLIISKFINFLVKSGHKNRAIKLFFKALFNLKNKFGINPILLIKYIILKRNVLHKVTTKKVKQKTFYYLRLLDFEKQISNTIKKIMTLILFLKEKKKLKLWQSIFLILLNFCILKNKKKKTISIQYDRARFNSNISNFLNTLSLLRFFSNVRNRFLRLYLSLRSNIFLLRKVLHIFSLFKILTTEQKTDLSLLDLNDVLSILLFYKIFFYYAIKIKYKLLYFKKKYFRVKQYFLKLKEYKEKIKCFFASFKRLKKKYILHKISIFKKKKHKKKMLNKNKVLLRNKYRQHFLTRFFTKDLNELKKASKFKSSFLNFKLRNKKRKELQMGTRIHSRHDIRLRHRKIFFRVSKYGQIKK